MDTQASPARSTDAPGAAASSARDAAVPRLAHLARFGVGKRPQETDDSLKPTTRQETSRNKTEFQRTVTVNCKLNNVKHVTYVSFAFS